MRKKALCLIAKYPYPFDTRLAQQAQVLANKGLPVHIYCLAYQDAPRCERQGSLTIFRMIRKKSKETFLEYFASTFCFMAVVGASLAVRSIFFDYRVLIVHTLPEFLVFTALFNRLLGGKIILDCRDLTVELLTSRWRKKTVLFLLPIARLSERVSTRIAHSVITASNGFMRRLSARGVPREKMVVLFNTADVAIFSFMPAMRAGQITDGARIIYHGTVSERFGLVYAVEALKLVQEKIPGSQLFVFGAYDESYRKFLDKRIDALGLHESVHLNGVRDLAYLSSIIRRMDMGIVPYVDDHFMRLALSTKTFEYVASGLPVVGSRLASCEELFPDECIQYARPQDPADFAGHIVHLCLNPGTRDRKRHCAYEAFKGFSSDVVARRYGELIDRFLFSAPANLAPDSCGSELTEL